MNKPEITIVISLHNEAPYLEKGLNSIFLQSDPCFDLIVIDDGSTDQTFELCTRIFAEQRKSVQLFRIPHSGIGHVRNYGLAKVETEYVIFMDGDDSLDTDTIKILRSVIKRDSPDLVVFGFWYEVESIDHQKTKSYAVRCSSAVFQTKQEIQQSLTQIWNSGLMYSTVNKLFRMRKIKQSNLLFEKRIFGEDFKFCREFLSHCDSLTMVDDCCYHYICHQTGSLSTVYKEDLFDIRLEEHLAMAAYFNDQGCFHVGAAEFLARRHIERVVGCIENECSPFSLKSTKGQIEMINRILNDGNTIESAQKAHLNSIKMKLLVFPIRKKWVLVTYLMGRVMTGCRYRFPKLFMWLKMHR